MSPRDFIFWLMYSLPVLNMLYTVYILRNFKNATFYVDCFLYWIDLMLFPIQYFILSLDKEQLTVKQFCSDPLF